MLENDVLPPVGGTSIAYSALAIGGMSLYDMSVCQWDS